MDPLYLAYVNGHLEIANNLISKNNCDVKGKFNHHSYLK